MGHPYLRIRPSTAGERLFQRLIVLAETDFKPKRIRDLIGTRIAGRGDEFGDYLEGALLSFSFLRLMKAADGIYYDGNIDISAANKQLVDLMRSWFDWLEKDVVSALHRDVLRAYQSSHLKISRSIETEIWHSRRVHPCCFCGERIVSGADGIFRDGNGEKGTLEHIWPASLGGDSVVENLLPACALCNNNKADLFTWEQRLVHDFVYPVNFEVRDLYKTFPREEKILLQRRVVTKFAARYKITLKEAMCQVGPYERLEAIDSGDTWDFFNVKNHTDSVGDLLWQ